MKRDIYKQLVSLKQSSSRKPLVLKGAHQVGQSAPFPVGKVNFFDMHPMSFGEFLDAVGNKQFRLFSEYNGALVYARS